MTFDEAEERPFETIMSGPVAGAEGAGELSRKINNANLVTADVGGTSFDTCIIFDAIYLSLYPLMKIMRKFKIMKVFMMSGRLPFLME